MTEIKEAKSMKKSWGQIEELASNKPGDKSSSCSTEVMGSMMFPNKIKIHQKTEMRKMISTL